MEKDTKLKVREESSESANQESKEHLSKRSCEKGLNKGNFSISNCVSRIEYSNRIE